LAADSLERFKINDLFRSIKLRDKLMVYYCKYFSFSSQQQMEPALLEIELRALYLSTELHASSLWKENVGFQK
jgi:hypothetical protein